MSKDMTPDAQRQEELLTRRKKQFTGPEWPEMHPEITECDYDMVARMLPGMTPFRIGDENEFDLAELMNNLVDDLLGRLDSVVANILRQHVSVSLVRSGRPHASRVLSDRGRVGVQIDGSLMLLYYDLLGHALSLMTASVESDGIHFTVTEPTSETIASVGSLLWAFRNSRHGFNTADMPTISTDPHCGLDALKAYLKLGEQFILGHEFWHALNQLSVVPDRLSIRKCVQDQAPSLSSDVVEKWDQELCADIGSVSFLLRAESRPGLHGQVVASAMIGVSFLGVLERAYTRPSDVPNAIAPSDIDCYAMRFPTHPPMEVRREVLAERFGHVGEGVRTSEVYHVAFRRIIDGLDTSSCGGCVARPSGAWCGRKRGSVGLFCADHGWAFALP